jgi:hypothetical protein
MPAAELVRLGARNASFGYMGEGECGATGALETEAADGAGEGVGWMFMREGARMGIALERSGVAATGDVISAAGVAVLGLACQMTWYATAR